MSNMSIGSGTDCVHCPEFHIYICSFKPLSLTEMFPRKINVLVNNMEKHMYNYNKLINV